MKNVESLQHWIRSEISLELRSNEVVRMAAVAALALTQPRSRKSWMKGIAIISHLSKVAAVEYKVVTSKYSYM